MCVLLICYFSNLFICLKKKEKKLSLNFFVKCKKYTFMFFFMELYIVFIIPRFYVYDLVSKSPVKDND